MSLNTRIKNKRDTAANWETRNPVLLEGEVIIVTTNAGDIRFKVGDGVKTYTQLPFQDESLYNILRDKADSGDLEALRSEVEGKQNILTFDSTPTANSTNPVTSGGVKTAVDELQTEINKKQNTLTFDSAPTENSTNPVMSGGIKTAIDALQNDIDNKQNALTFDSAPTSDSTNPVTSGGIKSAIDSKQDKISNITINSEGINVVDVPVQIINDASTEYMAMTNLGLVVVNEGAVLSATTDTIQFVGVDGTLAGLGTPTADDHATNKEYVDGSMHAGAITTAGTGAAYTATVPGIDTLTSGVNFIMVPHTASTTTAPTLNVNGLGAKSIKRRVSTITGTLKDGYADSWLGSNNPIHVIYNGTYWVVQGMEQPNVNDLSGAVPITKGGTGCTAIADTTYTTARYRASALYDEQSLVDPTTNGVINWAYA